MELRSLGGEMPTSRREANVLLDRCEDNRRDREQMMAEISAERDTYVSGRDQYLIVDQLPFETWTQSANPGNQGAYDRSRPIFVQYLNPEIRACYGKQYRARNAGKDLADALHATRLAILCTEGSLIFPASYLFEVPILPRFLESIEYLRRAGCINYSTHIAGLDSYVEHKAPEYRNDSRNPYARHARKSVTEGLVWHPRFSSSAAEDIAEDWQQAFQENGVLMPALRSLAVRWPTSEDPESILREVPSRLDGQAFIGRFVRNVIPVNLLPEESITVDFFLSRSYLESYLRDLDASILTDFTFGDLSCGTGKNREFRSQVLSARQMNTAFRYIGIFDFIHSGASWGDILYLRGLPDIGIVLSSAFDRTQSELLRRAVLRARKRYGTVSVTTVGEAATRIQVLAEEIMAGYLYTPRGQSSVGKHTSTGGENT